MSLNLSLCVQSYNQSSSPDLKILENSPLLLFSFVLLPAFCCCLIASCNFELCIKNKKIAISLSIIVRSIVL